MWFSALLLTPTHFVLWVGSVSGVSQNSREFSSFFLCIYFRWCHVRGSFYFLKFIFTFYFFHAIFISFLLTFIWFLLLRCFSVFWLVWPLFFHGNNLVELLIYYFFNWGYIWIWYNYVTFTRSPMRFFGLSLILFWQDRSLFRPFLLLGFSLYLFSYFCVVGNQTFFVVVLIFLLYTHFFFSFSLWIVQVYALWLQR